MKIVKINPGTKTAVKKTSKSGSVPKPMNKPSSIAKPPTNKPQTKPGTPAAEKQKIDAIKKIQDQVSPKGVKKAEEGAKKGLDKKYPGLYKKSK